MSTPVLSGDEAVEALERALGTQIRRERKAQGHTQQQLADLANTSLGSLRNLERGDGSSVRTLARVLRALGREKWIDELHRPVSTFNPFDVAAPSPGR